MAFAVLAAALVPAAVCADVRVWTDQEEVILKGTLKGLEVVPDSAGQPAERPPLPLPGGAVETAPIPMPGQNRPAAAPKMEKLSVGDLGRRTGAGGTLVLKKGNYFGGTLNRAITVRCEPGARIYGTGKKAALRVDASPVVIDGCQFRDSRANYNSAGIWAEGGMQSLTIRNSLFINNGNGIIVGNIPDAVVTIENCTFSGNGAEGRAHQLYISGTDTRLFVRRSTFRDTVGEAHVIKTGAKRTVIEDSRILGSAKSYSRAIDAFAGGVVQLVRVRIVHGPDANRDIIAFGAEAGRAPDRKHHRLTFQDVSVKCLRSAGCALVQTWLPEPGSVTGVHVEGGEVDLVPVRK